VPKLDKNNVYTAQLANGSRIIAVPGDNEGDSIRGISNVRLIIVDEAARVSAGLISALRPMLAVNKDGALIMLSTPAGRRGKFFEYWTSGDPAWERVRVDASMCPRITAEFLESERKELGDSVFRQEYHLEFLDDTAAAFPSTLIDAMFDDTLTPLWAQ
jgi:hypothetical protein